MISPLFTDKDIGRMVALAVEGRNSGIITLKDFIALLEGEQDRRIQDRAVVATQFVDQEYAPGTECPSCGRGLLVSRYREGIAYVSCKFYQQPADPDREPQGCGWSMAARGR